MGSTISKACCSERSDPRPDTSNVVVRYPAAEGMSIREKSEVLLGEKQRLYVKGRHLNKKNEAASDCEETVGDEIQQAIATNTAVEPEPVQTAQAKGVPYKEVKKARTLAGLTAPSSDGEEVEGEVENKTQAALAENSAELDLESVQTARGMPYKDVKRARTLVGMKEVAGMSGEEEEEEVQETVEADGAENGAEPELESVPTIRGVPYKEVKKARTLAAMKEPSPEGHEVEEESAKCEIEGTRPENGARPELDSAQTVKGVSYKEVKRARTLAGMKEPTPEDEEEEGQLEAEPDDARADAARSGERTSACDEVVELGAPTPTAAERQPGTSELSTVGSYMKEKRAKTLAAMSEPAADEDVQDEFEATIANADTGIERDSAKKNMAGSYMKDKKVLAAMKTIEITLASMNELNHDEEDDAQDNTEVAKSELGAQQLEAAQATKVGSYMKDKKVLTAMKTIEMALASMSELDLDEEEAHDQPEDVGAKTDAQSELDCTQAASSGGYKEVKRARTLAGTKEPLPGEDGGETVQDKMGTSREEILVDQDLKLSQAALAGSYTTNKRTLAAMKAIAKALATMKERDLDAEEAAQETRPEANAADVPGPELAQPTKVGSYMKNKKTVAAMRAVAKALASLKELDKEETQDNSDTADAVVDARLGNQGQPALGDSVKTPSQDNEKKERPVVSFEDVS